MHQDLFSLLDVFVASAQEGSFSAAALRLRKTRSGVAKAVARLEQRLGAALFHRSTRRCTLTDLGGLYLEHALRVRGEMEAAGAALDEALREPRGRVRVTMPVVFGRRLVAPLLLDVGRVHRHLELELSFTDRMVDLAHEGFDVGIRAGAIPDSSELVARSLGVHGMRAVGSPEYLQRRGVPERVADLAQHDAFTYGSQGRFQPWPLRDADGRPQVATLRPRWRLDDLEAMRDGVLRGDGLAFLPSWLVADDIAAGRMETVFDGAPPGMPMHVVRP
ncbi:MAG: LysR family transcriptional regulator, partial [Lysobacter sp.]|nr:LysR family transcriptional regulator [Lysobacter sp.]